MSLNNWTKKFWHKKVFFDYASSSPVANPVRKVMEPYFSNLFYNPSAWYGEAVYVRNKIETSRQTLKSMLKVDAGQVVFTSGATEANIMAIVGAVESFVSQTGYKKPIVITSNIEHSSVINLLNSLKSKSLIDIVILPVSQQGVISLNQLSASLTSRVALVSIQMVNSELGVRQPILDIAKKVRSYRKSHNTTWPLLHSDGTQALALDEINFAKLGVDFLTFGVHKSGGPKGVGLLLKKTSAPLSSLFYESSQEFGYRAGTENVPLIIGATEAVKISQSSYLTNKTKLAFLRKKLELGLLDISPDIVINQGGLGFQSEHILNFTWAGIQSELLVIELAELGVMCSARSACSKDEETDSDFIIPYQLYDKDSQIAQLVKFYGGVRVSMGSSTRLSEIKYLLSSLRKVGKKYQLLK